MVGVIWYRFVRYAGTDSSATVVPIGAMRWYRFADIIRITAFCIPQKAESVSQTTPLWL